MNSNPEQVHIELDPNDPFSLVLGLENPQDILKQEEKRRAYTEIAIRVAKMASEPGYKDLLAEIARLEECYSLKPAYYSNDPKLAHLHTGALNALDYVKDWVEHCILFIKQQEYEQTQPK